MRISLFRKAHFNAAHRLSRDDWSAAQNKEVFGICSNPNFHGHNYDLTVKITGEVNPETGMLMNLKELKHIIKQHIENKFDHKNLNLDIPEMKGMIPTSENLCHLIWTILRKEISKDIEVQVRLYESVRNFVEYPAT